MKKSPVARSRTLKAVVDLEDSRQETLKAHVFEKASYQQNEARPASNAMANVDEVERAFVGIGAVEPPYNPWTLTTLLEHSNALRQNVDAYVTNIDAFGHRFEPVIDLEAADADEKISAWIQERRAARYPDVVTDPNTQIPEATQDEIDRAKKELVERMRLEKSALRHFFEFACLDISFVTLRRRTRQDIETQANGYWEVLRTESGKIAGFDYLPAFTVRHMPLDKHPTKTTMRVKCGEFGFENIDVQKYFRRYVQIFEMRVVYFKEFGDPRIISKKDGRVWGSLEEMREKDREDGPATEVIHFKVHTSKSSYGIPRWIGSLLAVLGSRQAEEVNLSYFENKSVPPLALLVSGGRVTTSTVDRIRSFIDTEVKGKRNFHKMLVIEAVGGDGSVSGMGDAGKMKVELKPLTGAQHNDALFQQYDANNIDKVGMSFRMPRLLRGDIRDFNRATAEAALEFAEMQVFGPERDEFDFIINRKILPVLNARFWKFKSNASTTRNAKDLSEMIVALTTAGVLTPAEARDLSEGIFNRELRKIDAPWVRQPLQLTVQGIAPPDELAAPGMLSPGEAAFGQTQAPSLGTAPSPPALPAAPDAGTANIVDQSQLLTGTDMAAVVTVNEARASVKLGSLKKPDGSEDPDGFLTVEEFKAKKSAKGQAVGEAVGQVQGEQLGGTAPTPVAHRRPPQNQGELLLMAQDLIGLRKAIAQVEAEEAAARFQTNLEESRQLAED